MREGPVVKQPRPLRSWFVSSKNSSPAVIERGPACHHCSMFQPTKSRPPFRVGTGRSTRFPALSLGLVLAGCSPSSDDGSATMESVGDETMDNTTMNPDSTGDTDDGTTGEPHTNECDVWAQDCPDGEKCVPWADDGGNAWNALRCAPVNGNGQPGDACTLMGDSELTGLDDCALGSICMRLDDGTDNGICVPQCEGSAESPTCADSGRTCILSNDGVLSLCMDNCDPIIQDCPGGMGCYPFDPYICWPDFSGSVGAYGDACMWGNACDPGLICNPAETVPDCSASACCTEYCNLDAPDPDAECSGQAGGQICQQFEFTGGPLPGYEHVGVCAIPS
jgi:hypothetical protein